MSSPVLEIDKVSMSFGGLRVIKDASFGVKRDDITAVIGPNGAGKTTVFNCISGFYKPTAGSIIYHDTDGTSKLLNKQPIHKIARLGISRTYQNIRLFHQMSAIENLLVAQNRFINGNLIAGVFKLKSFTQKENEAIEYAWHCLDFMGIADLGNRVSSTLPYGLQRRLEVARVLASRPKVVCLDEPAAGLNHQESDDLKNIIVKIRDAFKVSILLIEHHMGVVMDISDYIVVLDHGDVISQGDVNTVRNDSKVIQAYLGEV